MNLLPIFKCKLQEQRGRLSIMVIFAVVVSLWLYWDLWDSGKMLPDSRFAIWCVGFWMVSQVVMFAQWTGKDEFWYSLPFSKSQIFMVSLFVQQATSLMLLFLCLGGAFVTGVVSWSSAIAVIFTNTLTCGSFMVIVLLCFSKPMEEKTRKSNIFKLFVVVLLFPAILFPVALSSSSLGWWLTCFAVPSIVVALVALKRSLGKLEPITWERPLFEPEIWFESKISLPLSERPNITGSDIVVCHCPNDVATSESSEFIFDTVLQKCGSPVIRYVARTVWFDRMYALFLFLGLVPVLVSCLDYSLPVFVLFLVSLAGVNMINFSCKPIRALSPLPIEASWLFFLVSGPYFFAIILLGVLPWCLGMRPESSEDYYLGALARGAMFFYFLLGVRIACWGGKLADPWSKKTKQPPATPRPGTGWFARQKQGNWKQWQEQAIGWFSVAVVVFTWAGLNRRFFGAFDFRTFLLNHYLACWIILIVATVVFFRLSLQAFRRVY